MSAHPCTPTLLTHPRAHQAIVNFIYILYGAFMYGLQRLCFGQLRAIEVDQLSDRAWVAITETCLAMTIFREEIGAWFLVMFTLLVTGKVWGWIGDGRLEVLEQQPPANPRLFHSRLVVSLLMSTVYDIWLLRYCISAVVQQARPNMMVMFLFEFAVLSTSSLRTNTRYLLTILDARIVAAQTSKRLFQRRVELLHRRGQMLRQREADVAAGREPSFSDRDLPTANDVDELDIEVPGWEAKGQWVLVLELVIGKLCPLFSLVVEWLLTGTRLYQTIHLHHLLHRPPHVLRVPNPRHQ
ncbi:hypothetical protein IMZ48_05860 [Candidatus Bathyarchaeota archaeon]|nr:hypothetical protein [Candidatus Bathyarchaeota archaeon]